MTLVMIDALPREQVYLDPAAVVAIVPRFDDVGCMVLLQGGHKVFFPGTLKQAHEQIFGAQ